MMSIIHHTRTTMKVSSKITYSLATALSTKTELNTLLTQPEPFHIISHNKQNVTGFKMASENGAHDGVINTVIALFCRLDEIFSLSTCVGVMKAVNDALTKAR